MKTYSERLQAHFSSQTNTPSKSVNAQPHLLTARLPLKASQKLQHGGALSPKPHRDCQQILPVRCHFSWCGASSPAEIRPQYLTGSAPNKGFKN